MVSEAKNPVYVESGRRGAAKRWADAEQRKAVRLDDLTPPQRRLVLALIDAARQEAARPTEAVPV